jgi:hypothetical protein
MRKPKSYVYPFKTNQLSDEYWNALYVPLDGYNTEDPLPKKNRIKVEETRPQFMGKDQFFYVDPAHPYVKMLLANKVIIPVVKNGLSIKTDILENA